MKPGLFNANTPVGTRFLYKMGGREVHAGTVLGYSPTKRYVQLGAETWEECGFIQVLEELADGRLEMADGGTVAPAPTSISHLPFPNKGHKGFFAKK